MLLNVLNRFNKMFMINVEYMIYFVFNNKMYFILNNTSLLL